MLLTALFGACLINTEVYERRKADLTDHDGDSFVQQDDCDDTDAAVFPGAQESCDARDEDCDGEVDEDAVDAPPWFVDGDSDGFGAEDGAPTLACAAPSGHVDNALDCDDDATRVNPAASETPYDGVDDDCSGADLTDVDGDGHDASAVGGGDCDDTDGATYPGATEITYDGVDQDCDGADADDLDGDGQAAVSTGGEDCDDTDAAIFVGAPEEWADGLTDNDCDGALDAVRLDYGADAWVGESAGAQAGRRLGPLGDVTGDGLADYLVGAPYEGAAFSGGGAVYLVEGGSEGGELSTANVILPSGADWYMPQVVEGGPDVDADGVPDLVATAAGYEGFLGAAFVVSGAGFGATNSLTLPQDAMGMVEGDRAGDLAGTGAAFLGDVVGDGGEYLAVTSLFASPDGIENAGQLSVFSAEAMGSARMSEAEVVVAGPYAEAGIGNLVAPAGDIDGDGVDDYMVTVTYGDLAYVLPGGVAELTLPDDALFRLTGTGEPAAAEMIGDVDGDGERDLACIVASEEVRVFTTLVAQPVRTIDEHTATIDPGEGALVYDLQDLGDVDGDGLEDTYVPAQWDPSLETSVGAVVFGEELGFHTTVALSDALLSTASLRPNGRFGYRVARSPDVDGDGGEDILVGGYSDSEGGADAGAVLTIPVPR